MTNVDPALVAGASIDEREQRLAQGAEDLAEERSGLAATSQPLLIGAGALLTAGITLILLGWFGASRSTIIEEQVPYLISGGLLGVALAIVGAVTYFSHWLTVLIREARDHETARAKDHEELMAALRELRTAPREEGNGTAGGAQRKRSVRRAQSRP